MHGETIKTVIPVYPIVRSLFERRHTTPTIRTDNGEITADNRCGVHFRGSMGMSVWQRYLPRHPELKHHPIVQHAPLNTRDVPYGGRTEALVLHYATREGETILYYDVMSLYPYVCKYSKFPLGQPTIRVGDACHDKQAMLSKEGLIKYTVLPHKKLYHPL